MDLTRTSPPRILLVEDDTISREVLAIALREVPAEVHPVASLAAARGALVSSIFDAWLVDAHLPDGDGRELLALRPAATVALAHTAATDTQVHDGLRTAGFVDVLVKPITAAHVQASVRRVLGMRDDATAGPPRIGGPGRQPVWDDTAALHALAGNAAHVRALRGLFVGELAAELEALGRARTDGDVGAIRARLHRLRASCGFVGAARVGAHLAAAEAMPLDDTAFNALCHALRATQATPDPMAADVAAQFDAHAH